MESDGDDEFESYEGSCDGSGQPHGRGTLRFSSGDRFEGKFSHGVKEGRGAFFFQDGSSLSGSWTNDELNGIGSYLYADGRMIVAAYKEGELDGPCNEYDDCGLMTFRGQYAAGVRVGVCHSWDQFGGHLFGLVSRHGMFTGSDITYVYPDGRTALVGRFQDGDMVQAMSAVKSENGEKNSEFVVTEPIFVYKRDVSSNTCISSDPLLSDVYEQKRVFVAPSTTEGAGEGLFAKIHADEGEIMSFYNGIRLSHDVVDNRDWCLNSNTISLNDEIVIDVPQEYSDTTFYCASLGHKANHSFSPNCKYDRFDHPRFGEIKCIRTIAVVHPGDELTVEYGYNHHEKGEEAPAWYKDALKRYQQNDLVLNSCDRPC